MEEIMKQHLEGIRLVGEWVRANADFEIINMLEPNSQKEQEAINKIIEAKQNLTEWYRQVINSK